MIDEKGVQHDKRGSNDRGNVQSKGDLTERQKKIVAAAIESFAEKGYSATSTKEIAQKAGVAEGTIFRHYKTKRVTHVHCHTDDDQIDGADYYKGYQ